jgi:predicted metal-dependent hydrolase
MNNYVSSATNQVQRKVMTHPHNQVDMTVRKGLDFKLRDHMSRHWFGGDPFKTRIFDALSLTFPVGERYFISSVRLFRDQITDPELQARVADFIQQEAQHGLVHDEMNEVMREQGMPLDRMVEFVKARTADELRKSPEYNIAMTAGFEHLTAMMANAFYDYKATMAEADPYVRALFAWHAIEEMEHRDVAFDVMNDIAKVSYPLRAYALVKGTTMIFGFTLYRANKLLAADGFTGRERIKLIGEGLPWLFGKQGVLSVMKKPYLDWFKPNFHPSQHPVIAQYPVWLKVMQETGDPIQAGEALWEAAAS